MSSCTIDWSFVRKQFPALNQKVFGAPLVYLDSAATTLKPQSVVDRITRYYSFETANVHRGAHYLSDRATEAFEASRATTKKFFNADSEYELIWTRGTTESINLVAGSYGEEFLQEGDEIVLTYLEHHSNIVPWQMLAKKKNLKIKWVQLATDGDLDYVQFEQLLSMRTKIVAVTHCSNTLGVLIDVERIVSAAHRVGAKVLVDAAQSISSVGVNLQKLNCDFLVFSGHKLFGPYGIGGLFARRDILNTMPPYQGGGSMIDAVTIEGTTYLEAPHRFEAGTPAISAVIGLHPAIEFFSEMNREDIIEHEKNLIQMTYEELKKIPEIIFYGPCSQDLSQPSFKKVFNILSFNFKGAHCSDVGALLNQQGVAVRAGHHCTQVLMKALGVPGTVRVSFSIYNNEDDVNRLVQTLQKAKNILYG